MPEVRWRAGAARDDRAAVRRQRTGCGSQAERRRRRTSVRSPDTGQQPRNWRLWAVGVLDPGCCSGSSRPTVFCSGGRGRVPCCGSAWRCLRGTAGRRPCQPVDGERGKRPGGARRTFRGPGQAHRPLLPPGRGGGPVVVVRVAPHQGGRESRPQGDMSHATYRPPCCAKKYVALRRGGVWIGGDRARWRDVFSARLEAFEERE